jgi:hypothetical protein
MTGAGEMAFIEHEDGGLFHYRFGGTRGVIRSYRRVDGPRSSVDFECEKRGWAHIDKQFDGMRELNEFRTRFVEARRR